MELLRGGEALSDDELLELYAYPDRAPAADGVTMRVNFVSSLDGSATVDGRTAAIGGAPDLRVFRLLRRLAQVVLVGAGTLRIEGYTGLRVSAESARWREARGMPPHPVLAAVTHRLDLDPESSLFTEAPVRPLILTSASSDAAKREVLAEVADVVLCGDDEVDPLLVREALAERGLDRVLCEGGPRLFASLIAADAVDELCLTTDATLEGGRGPRIVHIDLDLGEDVPEPRPMAIAHLLREDDVVLGRYVRRR